MSHRQQQVESTLRRTLAEVLARELSDPRVVGMVSITKVKVTADLREAQVFISVMPAKYESRTLHGLQHASGYIHGLVHRKMAMRQTPRLQFRVDQGLKKEADVYRAISRGMEVERSRHPDDADQPPPQDQSLLVPDRAPESEDPTP